MPKNQKLGALEQALLDIAEYEASPMAAASLARIKAGHMRAMQDAADVRSGKVNPMLEAVKAFTPGLKNGGKVKGRTSGSNNSARGMGAALRGGNFSGVR